MSYDESVLAVAVSADDHAQGDRSALVTLVEYGDYQCPACGQAYPLVKQIQRHYAGNVCFVFRNFPLSQAHPLAQPAAEMAEASARLGEFWAVHDWLYENQGTWTAFGAAGLVDGLRELGIDESSVTALVPEADARIRHDFAGGVRSGVNGTPSFFVNGRLYQGDFGSLARTIGSVIARHH